MKPQQIRDILQQTLDDRRLSRTERTALDKILEHIEPTDQVLALYRSMAFDLALEEADSPDAKELVGWLEDVVKLLASQSLAGPGAAVAESHFSPSDSCPRRIARFISDARRTIDICVFTITDDRISSAILEAHNRGRRVRIITDDNKATDLGSDCDRLADAGIPVRVDRTSAHMHHKFALADSATLLTGSYNWTRSAARENEDNFLITGDRRFVEAFRRWFEKMWKSLDSCPPP
jgi:phosphatidylserine/phosphatidylglycerophosphate/cardiolipin synthase-like enzyme